MAAAGAGLAFETPGSVAVACAGPAAFAVATLAGGSFPGALSTVAAVGLLGMVSGASRRQIFHRARQTTLLAVAEERAEVARREATLVAERNHLGREIHDVLAHTLRALSIQLMALDTMVDGESERGKLREELARTHRLVADGLVEAKQAVRALREDAASLPEQLAGLCRKRTAHLQVEGTPRLLAAQVELALYRVTQEALTNATKHADGVDVKVRLGFHSEEVTLQICNELPASLPGSLAGGGGGYGLQGMRERVLLLGGQLTAGPCRGVGGSTPRFRHDKTSGGLSPMRVVITDDQRVIRDGLITVVGAMAGIEVVGAARDGTEAVALADEQDADVVLMDLRMPGMDGVEATTVIRARRPTTTVVVLTTYADDDSVLAALRAGATGYLTKDASRDDIHRALQAAAAGQGILDPIVQARLVEAASQRHTWPAALPDGLTEREAEILTLIAEGLSNTEIAERIYVSESTVKTHINRIFAKTHSRDRSQAIVYAHRHRLTGKPSGTPHAG
ncbi:MAG: response regulator [Acidimicrobiales bacterium]